MLQQPLREKKITVITSIHTQISSLQNNCVYFTFHPYNKTLFLDLLLLFWKHFRWITKIINNILWFYFVDDNKARITSSPCLIPLLRSNSRTIVPFYDEIFPFQHFLQNRILRGDPRCWDHIGIWQWYIKQQGISVIEINHFFLTVL